MYNPVAIGAAGRGNDGKILKPRTSWPSASLGLAPRGQWVAERRSRGEPSPRRRLYVTDEEDLANAYLAALEAVATGHGRFESVFIAGDEDEDHVNLSKARRLLDWTPRTHLKVDTTPP